MFDDPKKELVRLEELLLEEESRDEDFERFYSDIFAEFGPGNEEPNGEIPIRNHANNYGRTGQSPSNAAPRRNAYADSTRSAAPVKKDNSIRNLGILAFVEAVGIVALVLWWTLRIL